MPKDLKKKNWIYSGKESRDHSDHRNEMKKKHSLDIEEGPGDLKRLDITQTSVKRFDITQTSDFGVK